MNFGLKQNSWCTMVPCISFKLTEQMIHNSMSEAEIMFYNCILFSLLFCCVLYMSVG